MEEKLSYQEMLRTLGTVLSEHNDEEAVITVTPDGAALSAPWWRGRPIWDLAALGEECDRQRKWRTQPRLRWDRPTHVGRRLRAVGAELDAMGGSHFVIRVRRGAVHVEAPNGHQYLARPPSIEERVAEAGHLRFPQGEFRAAVMEMPLGMEPDYPNGPLDETVDS
jgi:hypothetical protein